MKRSIAPRIAWRLIRIRRSRGASGAIATVSVAGVAVAVAAIICVLSVFNGFREILDSRSARMIADIEVTPKHGKTLPADSLESVALSMPDVEAATPVVCDQALAIYNGHEMPVRLYAADLSELRLLTDIDSIIYKPGRYPRSETDFDSTPEALISAGTAVKLSAYPESKIFLFTPRREGTINPSNPAASFITDSVAVTGIFESGDELFDTSTIILPAEVARPLFMLEDDEATSLIIKIKSPDDAKAGSRRDIPAHIKRAERVKSGIQQALGPGYNVKTRAEQQQTAFRMVNIEKWVTFLLLIFILLIASFNIISTMTMFVLEKRHDLRILRALGMTRRSIGAVFAWQSAFVTAIGTAAGMLAGLILSLLQQHFGWITMGAGPDGIPIPYPVRVDWLDFPAVLLPTLLVGLIAAWTAAAYSRRSLRGNASI